MSKRFGRNQRRKLRESVAQGQRDIAEQRMRHAQHIEGMQSHFDAELCAARMARNTIRIDVDSLMDPRDLDIHMRATFEMASREPLYSAYVMRRDRYEKVSDRERQAFIKFVGESLAQHALGQIIRHWRSR